MGRRALIAASVWLVACAAPFQAVEPTPTGAAAKPEPKAEPTPIRFDGIALTSTASPEVTERVVARLRGRLKSYRQFLQPRIDSASAAPRELAVRLYGTSAAYRTAVANYGIRLENPACYLWEPHVILLGFDGAKYDDVLAAAQERAAKLKQDRDDASRRFAESQKDEEKRFRRENVAAQVRHDLSQRRKLDFQRTNAAAEQQRKEADEKNERLFDEATARLLALAEHELFHAYVQSEVYSQADPSLPPWLDEGLAQIVEHARRRGDALVVDVPSPALVQRLRQELKQGEPPPAASVLGLGDKHYLLADRRQTDDVRRRYLYAWALAQLLVETKRLTPRTGLDRYVADLDHADPTSAFARFTNKSPAEFETEWRAYLKRITR